MCVGRTYLLYSAGSNDGETRMAGEDRAIYRVVSAEICRDGKYLISQRSMKAVLPLLWEFPGGRVRDGETDTEVLQKSLKSRIGVTAEIGQMVMEVTHEYQGYDLMMCVYQCDIGDQVPTPRKVHDVAWIAPEEFGSTPFRVPIKRV